MSANVATGAASKASPIRRRTGLAAQAMLMRDALCLQVIDIRVCFLESAHMGTFGSSCFHQLSFTCPLGPASAGLSTGVVVPPQPWGRFSIVRRMKVPLICDPTRGTHQHR